MTSAATQRPMPELAGVRHSFVQAGELRMHVAEAGEGPPVVLLHGWPQHWYMWRDAIEALAERHRVVCPDLRGFGWSDAPPAGYEKERMAGDVLTLLDELGVERADVMGHDWGGWIAFLIALRAPERVRRLLALNIPHPFASLSASLTTLWRFWYQLPLTAPLVWRRAVPALPVVAPPVLRWIGASSRAWTPEQSETYLGQLREPARARATMLLYRSFLLREAQAVGAGRYRALRLTVPTLLVHGVDDAVVRPEHLEGYEPYADDMRVELVPDTGHFIVDERPALVIERALELFGGD